MLCWRLPDGALHWFSLCLELSSCHEIRKSCHQSTSSSLEEHEYLNMASLMVLRNRGRNLQLHNKQTYLCLWEFSVWTIQVVETIWWLSISDWCWDQGPLGQCGFRGTKCPSGQGQLGSVYYAPLQQTQGPSDNMSQDIPEWRAPSSRARAGIPPERWGNSSVWNARI